MNTAVFFPQAMLDLLLELGKVDLEGEELVVTDGGYRYKVEEAVRVLIEVTTGEDPHGVCGKVRLRDALAEELGAELLGGSMLIEDNAYDVVPGFLGKASGSPDDGGAGELAALRALHDIDE